MAPRKQIPKVTEETKELPEIKETKKELPVITENKKTLPPIGHPENTVIIGGTMIEILPTKLKYQRDRTAAFYKAVEMFSVTEILTWNEENMGDGRDGDKALMDWLIAVTDNVELITKNYDDMDTALIEKMLEIFKRVNKIQEKEEARLKNVQLGKTME